MTERQAGTATVMDEITSKSVQEHRPIEVEGVPDEEGVDAADAAERVEEDPEEQVNREQVPIADADHPDDT